MKKYEYMLVDSIHFSTLQLLGEKGWRGESLTHEQKKAYGETWNDNYFTGLLIRELNDSSSTS